MDKVLAKMQCMGTVQRGEGSKEVSLWATYGDGTGNEDFAKATPYGNCILGIEKDVPAADFFEEGESYYITFEKVPKGESK